MSGWNYQRNESKAFKPIPEGEHRIRIASAERATASTGKQMLTLKFDVSGEKGKLFHNIVFLPDRPEITNKNLTQFFDSFADIPEGEFELAKWVGKVGACMVKHEEYNGNTQARVHYFIRKSEQANLPAWVEPDNGGDPSAPITAPAGGIDDEIPFP
jgi:hypothetical protein